jgi:hypothetical protein
MSKESSFADCVTDPKNIAFSVKSFAIGTQWHPEFKALNNPDSVNLFTAFGEAVRAYARGRRAA